MNKAGETAVMVGAVALVALVGMTSMLLAGVKLEQSKWTCTKSEIINGDAVCMAQERKNDHRKN